MKFSVRVVNCFTLNGVLVREAISSTPASPEDQQSDELGTTELLQQYK